MKYAHKDTARGLLQTQPFGRVRVTSGDASCTRAWRLHSCVHFVVVVVEIWGNFVGFKSLWPDWRAQKDLILCCSSLWMMLFLFFLSWYDDVVIDHDDDVVDGLD